MTTPTTMNAVRFREYGGAEKLELCQLPIPSIKENELLIAIRTVSINDWDWQILQGALFVNRLDFGLRAPRSSKQILGCDIAGTVVQVGEKVTSFQVGDSVYGDISEVWGGFAEYAAVPESELRTKPESLTFEEAASLPQAGVLAAQAVTEYSEISDGQTILVNGAGGGVGTFAAQIASQHDISLTGVDTAEKREFMESLGYESTIDFRKTDITELDRQFDLILDNKMTRSPFKLLSLLKKNGRYIALGGSMKHLFSIFFLSPFISLFCKKKFSLLILKPNSKLDYLNDLCDKGVIVPKIGATYPLEQLGEAMKFYGEGKHLGKVVITISHDRAVE